MRRIVGLLGTGLVLLVIPGVPPATADSTAILCDGRVASIIGTAGDDVLTGTDAADVIAGLAGNDTLAGVAGDDVLCGDEGADVLEGGDGADRLFGGLDETFLAEDGLFFEGGDTIRPGPGDDHVDLGEDARRLEADPSTELLDYSDVAHEVIVDLGGGVALADGTDTLVVEGVHHVLATPYDDLLIGSGREDWLCGGDGDDELRGLAGGDMLDADGLLGTACSVFSGYPVPTPDPSGNDRLDGGPGKDFLASRAGADVLIGSSGRDQLAAVGVDGPLTMRGGAGRDFVSLRLDRGADLSVMAGAGRDELGISRSRAWKAEEARVTMSLDLGRGVLSTARRRMGTLSGFENLTVGRGTIDPWRVRGTAGRNTLFLGYVLAPVTILGVGGRDVLVGGHADDVLDGGSGRDRLIGKQGHDRCRRGEAFETCEVRD